MEIARIAFLGTGIMGAPMARNIAAAGFDVAVWNRTGGKAEALADVVRVATGVADAVADADAVITMVADGGAVTDLYFGTGGAAEAARRGALFIDMSSIAPEIARDHAARLGEAGHAHIDAPVSGGEAGAIAASLVIMAGAEEADFARARPLFESMGRPTFVGGHGAGQAAKLVNQAIVGVTIGAVSEGLLLAEKTGCDPVAVRETLMGGFATSRILELHGQRMLDRNWTPGGAVRMQLKDLENAVAAAEAAGLTLPLTEAARTAYRELATRPGGAELDHSAYLVWLEERNGLFR
ncbi:2-hydroxy-3-oxopropionate reductase [Rhodobium orientis]|uniref:2-hydroxy-3-oxopropionate reductase n=1 Tax=Rhodobium orientis TaxID=34017 RepID=A0A327JFZ6_9HYPH|nr:NAD(P)-dependent oxidoreductase [Rhodobium orientis]MBB4303837.1 2-hydroxy-3-oxopropionate reductase [Rhodobium orientis]MBK5947955.1 2-hydroxy-3-oxopropionate reductase [Rhodobium orientis]RAI25317.1 2-hydroxy-3-oxopropionate reductase [Rhodobium orientis]